MKETELNRREEETVNRYQQYDDRYEATYSDGTVKHECWNSGEMIRKAIRHTEDEDEWN